MKGNRFYSIPYDARNDTKMQKLGKMQRGGKVLAFGRWQVLLAILYDENGVVDLSDCTMRAIVREEMDFKTNDQMDSFFDDCSMVGLIDLVMWVEQRHVINKGVVEQLDYQQKKKSSGSQGGRGKKKKPDDAESESD